MKRLFVGACAALMLAACATTPSTHLTEGKGLAAAWAALDAVANSLDSMALNKTLHGAQALRAADDLEKARQALDAASAAYLMSDSANAETNVTAATTLIADLVNIAKNPS